MAEASSRLDINLEASGRINSIMFISILEISKKYKGNNHKRWVLWQIIQKHNGYGEKCCIFEKERETDFINSS